MFEKKVKKLVLIKLTFMLIAISGIKTALVINYLPYTRILTI